MSVEVVLKEVTGLLLCTTRSDQHEVGVTVGNSRLLPSRRMATSFRYPIITPPILPSVPASLWAIAIIVSEDTIRSGDKLMSEIRSSCWGEA